MTEQDIEDGDDLMNKTGKNLTKKTGEVISREAQDIEPSFSSSRIAR